MKDTQTAMKLLLTTHKATANVKESLEWGTKIVGGVKPGVEGEHLGLPVFPSVRAVGTNRVQGNSCRNPEDAAD